MRGLAMILAGAACLLCATAASAEPVPTVDSARLQLARDIIAVNGGAKAYEEHLRAFYAGIGASMDAIPTLKTPGSEAVRAALLKHMAEEQAKAAPALLESTAQIYAERLTEAELQSLLEWAQSDAGRSIASKMPDILRETVRRQMPVMTKSMFGGVRAAIERACLESRCTPEQRQSLTAIVERAKPPG